MQMDDALFIPALIQADHHSAGQWSNHPLDLEGVGWTQAST